MTTRRRRLQVLAVLYVLAGAALIAWGLFEASQSQTYTGIGRVGVLLLTGRPCSSWCRPGASGTAPAGAGCRRFCWPG